ncbi:MAG: hypothetical protein MR011_03490 [Lachnospiraceae bacterium]|nr:hypothetical protein [Lachnospiraceae bacterium]
MAEVIDGILIREVETKNIMTKSSLPVGGYSVNPYVGCTHSCKYCYASFMKRFTGHTEEWGTFLDVKHWPEIKNPKKYAGQRVVIGSVTDGYNPQEERFGNTRKLLYDEIYNKHNRSYFEALKVKAEEMVKKYDCLFADNEMPYGRIPQGHPVIVDYFYHDEIRGTENPGKRNR